MKNMGLRIGIVKDERYLEHKTGHIHPENPNRLRSVYRMLKNDFEDLFIHIHPEPVPLEYLELVHTPVYIEKVLKTAEHNFTSLAPDTPASAMSYLAAWLAVGGCLTALDTLISGKCDLCFALVRPPGHHALADRAGGFCIFNNLGITAKYAIEHYGFQRILIIDWDIHHGNGIQELFYDKKEVLYFSSHDILLYPYTGDWQETGKDEGEGYTINIPISRELSDAEVLYLYHKMLTPIIKNYSPELILVAAGFDAHLDDPIGRSHWSEKVYYGLTRLILDLKADISITRFPCTPVLFSLEGGYNPHALSGCIKEVFKAFISSENQKILYGEKTQRINRLIEKARRIHSRLG